MEIKCIGIRMDLFLDVRYLNILHRLEENTGKAFVSLDVVKAFNKVEWPYLFNVLDLHIIGNIF